MMNKEMYVAPELVMVTFAPVEQLANGYLEGYASKIGGAGEARGASEEDIDIPIDGSEGSIY